jgi:hypothetical protein
VRPLIVVLVGFVLSFVQVSRMGRGDLRLDAVDALFDAEKSYLGDPGPSIDAARTHRNNARAPLYARDLSVGSAFIYPPIAAKLYEPFVDLAPARARASLSVLSRTCFVATLALLLYALVRRREVRPLELVLVVLGTVAFFPLVHAVQLNQATLFVTVLIGGAFVALTENERVAGVFIGLACAIKPQTALMLPLLWFHARRAVIAAAITAAVSLVASLSYGGVNNHWTYATHVLPTISRGYAYFANQSFNAFFQRLFVETDIGVFVLPPASAAVRVLTLLSAVVAFAATLGFVRGLPRSERLCPYVFGLAWLVSTAISPIAWQHHYAPALFLFVLLLRDLVEGRLPTSLAVLTATSFTLMAVYFEVRPLRGPFLQASASHVLVGACLLGVALVRSIRVFAEAR